MARTKDPAANAYAYQDDVDMVALPSAAKVASDTPVKAVQLYVAPGPEQRFTKGPIVKPTQPQEGE